MIMVGAGNNGGDALFAGVRLARRGVRVTAVRCLGTPHPGGRAALVGWPAAAWSTWMIRSPNCPATW